MSSEPGAAQTKSRAGWAGVAAVALAVGVGHLAASLTDRQASPVVALAARVIDASPTPLKSWAVATLGNLDKPVLVGGILAVTAALGVLVGRVAAARPAVGWGAVGALGLVITAAALLGPGAGPVSAVPGLAATAAGAAALRFLLARAAPEHLPDDPTPAELAEAESSRRRLLLGISGVASLALLSGVAGELVRPSRSVRVVTLPGAARPLPAPPATLPIPGMSQLATPQIELYRVDINVAAPDIDAAEWRLDIDGMVDRPYSLGWDELLQLEVIERDATLMCVSNFVGGPYIGSGRWIGVRTRDLLQRAGVRAGADMVLSTSWDSFTVSTPLPALLDERDAIVAVGFNGELLSKYHGYPARLLTPGMYGFVGATKWLRRLTVTRFADRQAYWTVRGWSEQAPLKLSSRIETPLPSRVLTAGTIAVGGSAWASRVAVAKVEFRVDEGPWREAILGPDGGLDMWRQWYVEWQATRGSHILECRAWDVTGKVQSAIDMEPVPDGAEGLHMVRVEISP